MKAKYSCTEDCSSPLLVAAQNGHLGVVEVLWETLNEEVGLNVAKRGGATPLYIACQNGHFEVVAKLVDLKAEVNRSLQSKETPLFIACQGGFLNVARLLVEHQADVDQAKQDGASPLYIACQNGHVGVVRRSALEKGNRISGAFPILSGPLAATPLFIASQKGHDAIVELLLRGPGPADVNKPLKSGATPLYIASLKGHGGVVQRLHASGACVDSTPKHGATAVSAAVQNDHTEAATIFLTGLDYKPYLHCKFLKPRHAQASLQLVCTPTLTFFTGASQSLRQCLFCSRCFQNVEGASREEH
ncbi:ankrd29 [Symbiodinium microadriaticum]|nr:ankrd29 [Symbiodinium microadriaticum]